MSYMPWKIIKNCLERDCILRIIKGRLCAEEKCKTTMYGAKIIEMRNKKMRKDLKPQRMSGYSNFIFLEQPDALEIRLDF